MDFINLYILSTYLKKWSFTENKMAFNYSFCFNDEYERGRIEMRIGSPMNMLNEIMNNVFHRAKEHIHSLNENQENSVANNIILVNESDIKRKLSVYLSKILKEFNQNKRSRGRTRMISTRSLDFYYNDFEFEQLDDHLKFFVHLNRGVNKMSGDLWTNAVDDLTLALQLKPDNLIANKNIAQALHKLGRYSQAVDYIKIYAAQENSPESLNTLANAYVHLEDFTNAEAIYHKIEEQFPGSLLALFGKAQLAYKLGKGYKTTLDKIYKADPDWLIDKLKTDWEYKIPGFCNREECMWNAATAARYLGFERPFDLTRKAFNEEVPSYFDSEKGTIRFVKTELDHWVEIMNRYKVEPSSYKTFKDKLTPAEREKGSILVNPPGSSAKTKKVKKTSRKKAKIV